MDSNSILESIPKYFFSHLIYKQGINEINN